MYYLGPSTSSPIERSAAAIDEIITFEAGPSAPNVIDVEISITDDLVALEATESYVATLEIVGSPDSQIEIGRFPTTTVSVLDDDRKLLAYTLLHDASLVPRPSYTPRRVCPQYCTCTTACTTFSLLLYTLGMIHTLITVTLYACEGVTVGFGSDGVSVQESSGQFMMCVVRDREALQDITVTISASDVTAIANVGK